MRKLNLPWRASDASHGSVADVLVREEPDEEEEDDEDDVEEGDDDEGDGYSE